MKNLSQFQSILKEYGSSAFVKHILIVATGTASAQIIGFLASPVISRLYSPEQFGGLAMIMTLASLLVTVSSLGYESAIVLPKSDRAAVNVLGLSSLIAFGFFLAGTAVFIIGGKILWHFLQVNDQEQKYFYFLPLVVFTNAVAACVVFWNNRKTFFQLNSYYRVALSLTVAVLSIVFGLYFDYSNGLILAFLITNIIFSGVFVLLAVKKSSLSASLITKGEMGEQARIFQQFPKYYLIQNFFDSFREYFFVLIINMTFSAATLGAYSFALRIVRVPLNLISSSISQVAFQKITAIKNDDGDVYRFVTRLVLILLAMSLPLAAVFLFFGPEIFSFVFGEQWSAAGEYTRLISVWLFANFVSSPISTVPLIFGKTRFSFYYSLAFNVISTGTFYLCSQLTNDFELTLVVTSIVSGVFLMFYIFQIVKLTKGNSR